MESQEEGLQPAFIATLIPYLKIKLFCMEAKEHFISVTTTVELRMVLHRFSEAVVESVIIEGQIIKLKLTLGVFVPVS